MKNKELLTAGEIEAEMTKLKDRLAYLRHLSAGRKTQRRELNRLSHRFCETVKDTGFYCDGGGLYLKVKPGSKAWVFRYGRKRRTVDMGLGSYRSVSLADARAKALQQRRLLAQDLDPRQERRAARLKVRLDAIKMLTFKQCAEACVKAHEAEWVEKHAIAWRNTLATYVYPVFGDLPVSEIDAPMIVRALQPHWVDKTPTMNVLRGRIEAVLDYAAAMNLRPKEHNPARWRESIKALLPSPAKVWSVTHHEALPWRDIPKFMAELRFDPTPALGNLCLQFLILTAARTSEATGCKWAELDLPRRRWTVPAERMKKGRRVHHVPLAQPALEVLDLAKELYPNSPVFVFSRYRGRPIERLAMWRHLRGRGYGGLTVHGFRSSFRDWAAERTNYPRQVIEASLAHTIGDTEVERAYLRTDLYMRRVQLMVDWAAFVTGPPVADAEEEPIAEILPLPLRAAQ